MTEPSATPLPAPHASMAPSPTVVTAGSLLREAREKQGLHIAVLAAAIKISPRKLDSLEGDRYSELPDATFTRALTQTVCRVLKIDPKPVLALLPAVPGDALNSAFDGLNEPFKGKDSRGSDGAMGWLPRAPLLWAAAALLLAAALVMYWPSRTAVPSAALQPQQATLPPILPGLPEAGKASGGLDSAALASSSPSAEQASAIAPGSPTGPAVGAASPASPSQTAQAAAAGNPRLAPAGAASVTGPAQQQQLPDAAARPPALPHAVLPSSLGATITVSEPVWVELTDSSGKVLFQRTIQPGEVTTFEQRPPLKLKIGNASGAKLSYKGEPLDLAPWTKSNVARVDLK